MISWTLILQPFGALVVHKSEIFARPGRECTKMLTPCNGRQTHKSSATLIDRVLSK